MNGLVHHQIAPLKGDISFLGARYRHTWYTIWATSRVQTSGLIPKVFTRSRNYEITKKTNTIKYRKHAQNDLPAAGTSNSQWLYVNEKYVKEGSEVAWTISMNYYRVGQAGDRQVREAQAIRQAQNDATMDPDRRRALPIIVVQSSTRLSVQHCYRCCS